MPFDLSNQLAKLVRCPDCDIEMQLFVSAPTTRVFASTILERTLFVCMNCQRLSYRLLAMRLDSSSSQELKSAGLSATRLGARHRPWRVTKHNAKA